MTAPRRRQEPQAALHVTWKGLSPAGGQPSFEREGRQILVRAVDDRLVDERLEV
jgi:hypothetical protein